MAGDWMKIQLELPDKPEVHYISGICNLEPDTVVGKLIRVWQWFNKHTTDGNAVGVTFALVDRLVGVTGFAEAMHLSGWLEHNGSTLTMPKFDRHTSESAKKRALSSERQSRFRNAPSVTNALPREEKRRSKPPIPPEGDFVPGLNLEAWNRWMQYRTDIRKPIKPASILAAQRKLAGYGNGQAVAVEQSIANGWTGLFEPKTINGAKVAEWWSSDSATEAKGRELGLFPKAGESWPQFKDRIRAKLSERAHA